MQLVRKLISFIDFEYEPPDEEFQQDYWNTCGHGERKAKYEPYVYDIVLEMVDELVRNNKANIIKYMPRGNALFRQDRHQWWRWDNWKVKLKTRLEKCGAIWFHPVSPLYTRDYNAGTDTEWFDYNSNMRMHKYFKYSIFGLPGDNRLRAIGKFKLAQPIDLLDLRVYGKKKFVDELESRSRLQGYNGNTIYLDDDPGFFRVLSERCHGCIQFDPSDEMRMSKERYDKVSSHYDDFKCRVDDDRYFCMPVEICVTYGGVDSIDDRVETVVE